MSSALWREKIEERLLKNIETLTRPFVVLVKSCIIF